MLYNVYTDDLNHHLQATGVGCYVGGLWVNSLSYVVDMVLLAPTVTALQTLLEVCRAYAGPHDIVYNTTKTVCMLVRPKQTQGQFLTRVRLENEELSFVEEFRYLGHITADCRDDKDIAVGNMMVRKFSFAPIEAKIRFFKSYCYPIHGCALWSHSFQNSIRKLTVSYSETFKRLINVPRYTSSSLAFAMNATDHIDVVFQKLAYSLMSRVIAFPNSIVTAIGNSDAYHESPLIDKWESMLYV